MRLGVIGGTFDPIHLGHLVAAEEALCQYGLDEVLFVPSGVPPHRRVPSTPARLRLALVEGAIHDHPHFWVTSFETTKEEAGYTVDTLAAVRAELGSGASLYFITGADAVLEMATWRQPERILQQCTVIAATRPGYDLAHLGECIGGVRGWEAIQIMEIPHMGVSSTEIRLRVSQGRSIRYLVPESVRQMIEAEGLYRET
jgi:nicotinate-nucleotide adenylyltransferase